MEAFNTSVVEDPEIVRNLEKFPNPNAIWAAYRAHLILKDTARRLLPDERPSYRQRAVDVFLDILLPNTLD